MILRVAIVGSRRRNTTVDCAIVETIVRNVKLLNPFRDVVIVSGACPLGADKFAAMCAPVHGCGLLEFKVPKIRYASKHAFREAAFARNREIAENCDICFALVHSDRTGGTENTIGHCVDLGKTCYLVLDDGAITTLAGKPASDPYRFV